VALLLFLFPLLGLAPISSAYGADAGQLPLGYRLSAGAFPWTGRLHALAFRTAGLHVSAALTQWEAGALLDRRDIQSRRLYLGGERLAPLHWHAIDAGARDILNGPEPSENGAARLAWLRGSHTDSTLRQRDTRLASSTDARVRVVPPPAWLPMQAGHTAFRQKHTRRRTTVWIGTRDGIVHGFDAVTGDELAGFLPRAMLPGAAALTAPQGATPSPPCPRPESLDADPSGTWRTLLLCGVPETQAQTAAVFVLDVSSPDGDSPIGLMLEVSATDVLPLTGDGPIRAAFWIEQGLRRWAAVAIVAPVPEIGTRAGLALLPLDRPVAAWDTSGAIIRLLLPDAGCGADTSTTRLLATTVDADASGRVRAAYATDSQGRLWRFGLEHLGSGNAANPAACLHRQGRGASAEPPVIVHTATGPFIVYASGSELSAIPDRRRAQGAPSRIDAVAAGDGVVLQRRRQQGDTAADGWTLALPHPEESITSLEMAGPVHLRFTTVTPDGRARSYLIDAASGESAMLTGPDGMPTRAITGLPFDDRFGPPVTVMSSVLAGNPTEAGRLARDIFEVSLWRIDGDTAHLMQQARLSRRRGRLGWRELIRTNP